jgi:mono/diheme cytochrome c family protein
MASRLTSIALALAILSSAGCDVTWPWQREMREQPSLASTHSPREPASGTLAIDGERRLDRTRAEEVLHNPLDTSSAGRGRALYGIYCAPCHGISGTGDGPVPQHFMVGVTVRPADLTSEAVQRHGDGWLYATIANGTARMPSSHYELTPRERWEIVTFVRQMRASR